MKKIFLGFCLVTLFAITACQKEQLQDSQNAFTLIPQKASLVQNSVNNQSVIIDTKKEQLAMALAKSLKNIEVRTIIKQEAMRQFDGDYDALYANINDKKMAKGSNFEHYLSENFITTNKSTINEYKSIVDSIEDLQFSVPVNCEKWNEKEQMPLVTYIPDNFDEKTTKYVRAFDSDGKVYLLSTQEEPEVPVIVIGRCERLNYSSSPNSDSKAEAVKLVKLSFNDLGKYETWVQGKPEIYIDLYKQGSTYSIGQLSSKPARKEVNKNWKTYNHIFCYWPANTNEVYMHCWEDDADYTIAISIGITIKFKIKGVEINIPLTVNSSFTNKDDNMGGYLVNKTDPFSDFCYTNGNLKFYMSK